MKDLNKMREVVVAGVGLTKWGITSDEVYEIGSEAVLNTLQDAEMEWNDIQAAFCGSVYQGTGSGHQVLKEIGLTGIPIVNVENACSSGSSAFRLAYQMVAAEIYDVVLALGMEVLPKGPIPSTAFRPWELTSGFNVQMANYANMTMQYMNKTGATVEDFSRVTIKNRKNGAMNPYARFQKPVTMEEIMNSRMVSSPLRLFHCSPLANGGAAVILSSRDKMKSKRRAVTVASSVLTSAVYGEGSTSWNDDEKLGITELSAKMAYEESGYGPQDMHLAQIYDSMSPSELWEVEKLGFCKTGEGRHLLKDGYFDLDGKLPTNTDGGLMSRGHPLGATGLAQIIEIVTQLRGEAGQRQVKDAKIGMTHAMGAGPNSSITVLKV